jgi:REP element-mobilizing transposase RayT
MANTYTALHYHLVFSTKNRQSWIKPEIEGRIWDSLGGIGRKNKMKPLETGGVEDHIHMLFGAPPTMAPSKAAQLIKGGSSVWIHHTFPELRGHGRQDGYGAITFTKSHVPDVKAYIQGQRERHRKQSLQEEFLELLKRHEIECDERYLWD